MKLHVHVASGKDREEGLALSLEAGLGVHGDSVAVSPIADFTEPDPEADVGAVFGLKGRSHEVMRAYRKAGKKTLMFDKALIRVPGGAFKQLRVSINDDTPYSIVRRRRPPSRWQKFRIDPRPHVERDADAPVVLALSSQKYCDYFGLGDATEYAQGIVAALARHTSRPIIYRPKPSWHDFVPIEGTRLSRRPEYLEDLLATAHVLVTHGSSAAIDAIIYGVPAITLGRCAASSVAGRRIRDVIAPPFPSEAERWQWLCNLAWCQWSVEELTSGEAWDFIRRELMLGR